MSEFIDLRCVLLDKEQACFQRVLRLRASAIVAVEAPYGSRALQCRIYADGKAWDVDAGVDDVMQQIEAAK